MQTPTGTGNDASPNFTWTAVDGATLYDLYVSGPNASGLAFREDSLTTNSFNAQLLPDGENYRVWVRAFDGVSFGPWSRPIDFTIDADTTGILATPTSPLVATFDTTPTFEWTNETGAATWDFFLTNGSTMIEQTGLTSATFTVGSALAAGDWTWWVQAKNGSDEGGTWSDPTALHVGGRTVILAPSGATVDNTPTFQWAAVQGAGPLHSACRNQRRCRRHSRGQPDHDQLHLCRPNGRRQLPFLGQSNQRQRQRERFLV